MDPSRANVPIVGQPTPVKIHDITMMAVVQCPCAPDAPVMTIRNVDTSATCPKCGTPMVIDRIHYDREPKMMLAIHVGQILRVQTASPLM